MNQKIRKRIMSFCLGGLLLLLLLLASCDIGNKALEDDTTETTAGETTDAVTERMDKEPADMPHDEKLLIGGVNITSYRIVYGRSPLSRKCSSTGKTIGEDIGRFLQGDEADCEFDYQTAVRLRDLIKEYYGYDVEVVKDSETPDESRYEILVGYTDRRASTEAKNELTDQTEHFKVCSNPYSNSKKKTQYLVCGGSFGATWHAVDEIEAFLKENQNAVSTDLSDLKVEKGKYDFTVVACVGDSITRGSQALPQGVYGNANSLTAKFGDSATAIYFEQYMGYPATLQREMWKDAIVYNFGRGGSTMRNYGDSNYYGACEQFKKCLDISNSDIDFDIVIMMHGTNDIGYNGYIENWDDAGKADFGVELKNQIDKIKVGSPNAKFVVNNTPHAVSELKTPGGSMTSKRYTMLRDIELQAVKDLKTAGYDVYHYDMNRFTIENLGTGCSDDYNSEVNAHKDFYNIVNDSNAKDPLHPNYRGYGVIADGMVDLVNYLVNGTPSLKYMIDIG